MQGGDFAVCEGRGEVMGRLDGAVGADRLGPWKEDYTGTTGMFVTFELGLAQNHRHWLQGKTKDDETGYPPYVARRFEGERPR